MISDEVTGCALVGSAKDIERRFTNYASTLSGNRFKRYPQLQDAYNDDPERIKYEYLDIIDKDTLKRMRNGKTEVEFVIELDELLSDLELSYFKYVDMVDGLTLINRNKTKACRHYVRCTENMRKAQTGIKNGNCKLSNEQVIEIRMLHSEGATINELVEKFGVGRTQISRIIKRISRGDVA